MIEELTFGKKDSKFVIKQLIPLDALVKGKKPIKREYEIILYNVVAPISHFPELGFDSWIRDKTLEGIVELKSEILERDLGVRDLSNLLGGTIGAGIGYFVGKDLYGAVSGAFLGGVLALEAQKVYDLFSRKCKERRIIKRTGVVKGTNLRLYSDGVIPIDNMAILFFGLHRYSNKFTVLEEDRELNLQEVKKARELINQERKAIQTKIEALFAKTRSREIAERHLEYKRLEEYAGIIERFKMNLEGSKEQIRLLNKIEINSNYRGNPGMRAVRYYEIICNLIEKMVNCYNRPKIEIQRFVETALLGITKRFTHIGNIGVKIERGCKRPLEEIRNEIRDALYDKNYFLENALVLDLKEIVHQKRSKIDDKYKSEAERLLHLTEIQTIPFCVLDKKSGVRTYGFVEVDIQSLSIAGGLYFDKGIVYKII